MAGWHTAAGALCDAELGKAPGALHVGLQAGVPLPAVFLAPHADVEPAGQHNMPHRALLSTLSHFSGGLVDCVTTGVVTSGVGVLNLSGSMLQHTLLSTLTYDIVDRYTIPPNATVEDCARSAEPVEPYSKVRYGAPYTFWTG